MCCYRKKLFQKISYIGHLFIEKQFVYVSVTFIIITSNDCIDPQAIILQVNLIIKQTTHKWFSSVS